MRLLDTLARPACTTPGATASIDDGAKLLATAGALIANNNRWS